MIPNPVESIGGPLFSKTQKMLTLRLSGTLLGDHQPRNPQKIKVLLLNHMKTPQLPVPTTTLPLTLKKTPLKAWEKSSMRTPPISMMNLSPPLRMTLDVLLM